MYVPVPLKARREPDGLELHLQSVVSCLIRVLGRVLKTSARILCAPNHNVFFLGLAVLEVVVIVCCLRQKSLCTGTQYIDYTCHKLV